MPEITINLTQEQLDKLVDGSETTNWTLISDNGEVQHVQHVDVILGVSDYGIKDTIKPNEENAMQNKTDPEYQQTCNHENRRFQPPFMFCTTCNLHFLK